MNFPELIRNIAIVGHLHHGKTSFVDMLVNETHSSVAWDVDRQVLHKLFTYIREYLIYQIRSTGTLHRYTYLGKRPRCKY